MSEITSMERVLKSLSFQEPDRVPLFLLLTMHGAKELGMTIREYFSSAENVSGVRSYCEESTTTIVIFPSSTPGER